MPFELSVLDIHNWADTLSGRRQLPRLLRRLALLHPGVEAIEFAADEDTQLGGFDGTVLSSGSHPFLPSGLSVWEMGVNAQVKKKADEDFEKRSFDKPATSSADADDTDLSEPTTPAGTGFDRSQVTYVFVTPRRWSTKADWINTKQQLGIWKDVRALNAGDLVTWLEKSPAVAVWFARLIGKQPPGAIDVEAAWEEYAQVTHPVTSPALVVGGRAQEHDQLLKFLGGPPGALGVQAESHDEAVAFMLGCIHTAEDTERETLLGRTVLVSTPETFRTLTAAPEPLVLVPNFTGPAGLATAIAAGHHVLVPRDKVGKVGGDAVIVPRPHRRAVQEALDDMGVPESRRTQLGRLGRRSMLALRRALATMPEFETPAWAHPQREFPVPVLLAGMWHDENEADQQVITRLGGMEYASLARTLSGWARQADPPVRRSGVAWLVNAPEDAWQLIKQLLVPQDIAILEAVALAVLGEPDSTVTLPADEQVLQRWIGTPRVYSDVLRDGLADTLALLGAYVDDQEVRSLKLRPMVMRVVTALLGPPATWETWAMLARWLPLLAEASPEAFLDAAERLTADPDVPLAALIQDTGHNPFFHSPHIHLLWALECLAWQPPYLPRVARVLFALARHDLPDPDTLSRPIRSLRLLLDGVMPSTTATVQQRLAALASLRSMDATLYAHLLQALLPTQQGWKLEPVTPRYRDWVPDQFPVATHGEYAEFRDGIVAQLLDSGRERPALLAFLLENVRFLTSAQRAAALKAIREYTDAGDGTATAPLCEALRAVLRDETERQQRALTPAQRVELQAAVDSGDATDKQRLALQAERQWASPVFTAQELSAVQALLKVLEPKDSVDRHAWLFEANPTMPGVSRFNSTAYWEAVRRQREEAVQEVWRMAGQRGAETLARRAREGYQVGVALATTGLLTWEEETNFLRSFLAHDTAALGALGWGYLRARESSDATWLEQVRHELMPTWTAAQQVTFFLSRPTNPDTWDAVQAAGAQVQQEYWDRVPVWDLPAESFEQAVQGLLSRGRQFAALQFVANNRHGADGDAVSTETVVHALEQVIRVEPADQLKDAQGMPYMLARLFEELIPTDTVSLAQLAELEWHLLDLLPFSELAPRSLSKQLDDAPEFFVKLLAFAHFADKQQTDANTLSQEEQESARRASEVLRRWAGIPGRLDNGTFDEAQWQDWVNRVRELGLQRGYTNAVERGLAGIIARAPRGPDGTWPPPAMCKTIEGFASDRLDRFIGVAVSNGRGIVTKQVYEGGQQEQVLAEAFRSHAIALATQFPRTARILDQLVDTYQGEAQDEEESASYDQDQ